MESAVVIGRRVEALVEGAHLEIAPSLDQPTLYAARERLVEIMRVLRDDPELRFNLLADVTAVDRLPHAPRFEIVYHLACIGPDARPKRLRVKTRVPGEDARVSTISSIWPAANWLEREVWDLFGVAFEAHPDLRRLLMPDDWEGHPLRKDYPVQISVPVRVREPLQVTQEEFVQNIEQARQTSKK